MRNSTPTKPGRSEGAITQAWLVGWRRRRHLALEATRNDSMRTLLIILALAATSTGLAACTSDPNSPAIKAFESANSCGPGGTSDISQCRGGR